MKNAYLFVMLIAVCVGYPGCDPSISGSGGQGCEGSINSPGGGGGPAYVAASPTNYRIRNNRLEKAVVHVDSPNLVQFFYVDPGATTPYDTVPAGFSRVFAIVRNSQNDTMYAEASYALASRMSYTIDLDSTTPPSFKLVTP